MAKVQRPLFSLDASGSIGDVITYSKTFGGNVCKKIPVVNVEPSSHQLRIREIYSEGVEEWNDLTEEQKEIYNESAIGLQMTGFNLFMQEYMNEHSGYLPHGKYGTDKYGQKSYT